MFADGFCWRRQTKLYLVPAKAEVNAELLIKYILTLMMLVDVPKLYGREAGKVILHMDSARSHTSAATYKWLNEHGIKYFTSEEWLANSPDLSPMDFFANGYFESQLLKRKYTTMNGMLKATHEEWHEIPLNMFQNALRSWPERVLDVHKAQGKQILKKGG
jgi:hypothetical protein